VSFDLSGSQATFNTDYQLVVGGTPLATTEVVIPSGRRSLVVMVNPIDDNDVEGSENVVMTLNASPDYILGAKSVAVVVIADDGAGFVMRRTLSNTGTQPIETEVYTHNFVIINGDVPIGPDYLMQTRFPLRDADLKLRGNAEAGEHDIRITRPIERGSAWAGFAGTDDAALNELTVSHSASGVRLTIAGDRPLARFAVWTDGRALCPEPFVTIKLAPGESQTWSTTYSFDAVEP